MLIRNALVIARPASEAPFFGWVRVRGKRIAALGEGEPPADIGADATRVIDAKGRILIPGLVNSHAHSHSSLTRGSAEGMTLEPWLKAVIREQTQLTHEQARVSA